MATMSQKAGCRAIMGILFLGGEFSTVKGLSLKECEFGLDDSNLGFFWLFLRSWERGFLFPLGFSPESAEDSFREESGGLPAAGWRVEVIFPEGFYLGGFGSNFWKGPAE